MPKLNRLLTRIDGWNYSVLLVAVLALMASQPFILLLPGGEDIIVVAFGVLYAISFHVTKPGKTISRLGLVVSVLWIVLSISLDNSLADLFQFHFLVVLVSLILTFLAAWCTLHSLFSDKRTDRDALIGAVFGYFLLALLWAQIYYTLELWQPGSFTAPEGSDPRSEFVYFSLVTMTTLGYGDFLPHAPGARILSGVQAAFGTLYVAVLIGRIIGAFQKS